MSAPTPSDPSFDAAEVLRVLRLVWGNAPAAAYMVHTHIYCSGRDEEGACLDCGGGGCTTCCDPYAFEQAHVFPSVAAVHLTDDAAKAHARQLLRRLFISAGGEQATLSRTLMREQLDFYLGFEARDGSGKCTFAASLNDKENFRIVAATVHKTKLAGVTKSRAIALRC